jgi:hypothetical protein
MHQKRSEKALMRQSNDEKGLTRNNHLFRREAFPRAKLQELVEQIKRKRAGIRIYILPPHVGLPRKSSQEILGFLAHVVLIFYRGVPGFFHDSSQHVYVILTRKQRLSSKKFRH